MLSNSRSTAVEMLVSADVHCRMCHIPGQRSRLHWFQAGRFTTSQGIQFVLTFAVKELTQKSSDPSIRSLVIDEERIRPLVNFF